MNVDRWNAIFFVVALMGAALVGCAGGAPEGESTVAEGAPGGVLIVVLGDTAAGEEEALAAQEAFGGADSVVFERHYTAATTTAAALLSMLTGYPVTAVDDEGEPAPERPTLAELFARMGYYTFAVVGGDRALLGSGIERGFEEYRFDAEAPSEELIGDAVEEIGRASGSFLGLLFLPKVDQGTVETLATALGGIDGFEDLLLVVTADHGPEDRLGESFDAPLGERVTHVPLLVRFPAGERPDTLAPHTTSLTSGLDILPSLVALAGRDISGALPGSNIFDGFFSGHALIESRAAWAFVQDNYKLIVSGEKALIYDLAADPEEQHDLAAEMTDRSRALLTDAIQTRTAMTRGLPGEAEGEEGIDPETLEHLKSLGYVQ